VVFRERVGVQPHQENACCWLPACCIRPTTDAPAEARAIDLNTEWDAVRAGKRGELTIRSRILTIGRFAGRRQPFFSKYGQPSPPEGLLNSSGSSIRTVLHSPRRFVDLRRDRVRRTNSTYGAVRSPCTGSAGSIQQYASTSLDLRQGESAEVKALTIQRRRQRVRCVTHHYQRDCRGRT